MKTKRKASIAPSGILHPLRTLVVDDSKIFLSSLRHFLNSQARVQVVGTAANGLEALQKSYMLTPDLVLMDLHMPRMDGLQATVLLRHRLSNTRIIIMTMDETAETKAATLAHGAHGFVGKTQIPETLMAEIQRVFLLNDRGNSRSTL